MLPRCSGVSGPSWCLVHISEVLGAFFPPGFLKPSGFLVQDGFAAEGISALRVLKEGEPTRD